VDALGQRRLQRAVLGEEAAERPVAEQAVAHPLEIGSQTRA
jgi:hypothetical protein